MCIAAMITPGMQNTDGPPAQDFRTLAPSPTTSFHYLTKPQVHLGHAPGFGVLDVFVGCLLLPQQFPGPRQFRQAPVTDQPAGGVP